MQEYFANIPKIAYEGPKSRNPFAFRYYNPDEVIGGKTMREHLKFAMAYWHNMCAEGTDSGANAVGHHNKQTLSRRAHIAVGLLINKQ